MAADLLQHHMQVRISFGAVYREAQKSRTHPVWQAILPVHETTRVTVVDCPPFAAIDCFMIRHSLVLEVDQAGLELLEQLIDTGFCPWHAFVQLPKVDPPGEQLSVVIPNGPPIGRDFQSFREPEACCFGAAWRIGGLIGDGLITDQLRHVEWAAKVEEAKFVPPYRSALTDVEEDIWTPV